VSRLESDYYSYMGYDSDRARAALTHYLSFFSAGPVLELACGRGEFLDLLREAGLPARGVDLDEGMVERAVGRGHEVALGDAVGYLEQVEPGSLGGVFCAHFLEHLPPEAVARVYRGAARAPRPGGTFVAAVPSAATLSVLCYDFWRDPTHVRFYDPVLLQFFARQAGLALVESGGNPRNHPGPPPGLLAVTGNDGIADLRDDIGETIRAAQNELVAAGRRRFMPDDPTAAATAEIVSRLGHLLWTLNKQSMALAQDVNRLRVANAELIAELYPANEVYVVARKGSEG
jgi:SAM-dependent methyltransferase